MNPQRVNIQYSISIDDLPGEINRLVCRLLETQQQLVSAAAALDTQDPAVLWSAQYVEQLVDWKSGLAQMQHSLTDVENLVKSYLRHLSTDPQEVVSDSPYDIAEEQEKLDQLHSLIDRFQMTPPAEDAHEITTETST